MKRQQHLILHMTMAIFCLSLWGTELTWAAEGHGPDHQGMHHPGGAHGEYAARERHHDASGHGLSHHWRASLSAEQQRKVDEMHLELEKKLADLRAKIALAKVDLALLVTMEKPQQAAIDKEIDKLVALKKQKIKSRYAHLVKMRQVLNEQQRLSFDMGVLKKATQKRKSGHH